MIENSGSRMGMKFWVNLRWKICAFQARTAFHISPTPSSPSAAPNHSRCHLIPTGAAWNISGTLYTTAALP